MVLAVVVDAIQAITGFKTLAVRRVRSAPDLCVNPGADRRAGRLPHCLTAWPWQPGRHDARWSALLDELRIEFIYPQDATAERFFRGEHPAERSSIPPWAL